MRAIHCVLVSLVLIVNACVLRAKRDSEYYYAIGTMKGFFAFTSWIFLALSIILAILGM